MNDGDNHHDSIKNESICLPEARLSVYRSYGRRQNMHVDSEVASKHKSKLSLLLLPS